MQTHIVVKLQYEAVHNWPKVEEMLPDEPFIHFLKFPHRHVFHITLEKAVTHSDRDVEIILFKREVIAYLTNTYGGQFEHRSCEMIAQELLHKFDCKSAEVLEDNENGAKVYA
jgi:hypothetical protein